MIKCSALGERLAAYTVDAGELTHQGDENSALKKSAPSNRTTFKTSERTSMLVASSHGAPHCTGVCGKNTVRLIKFSTRRTAYSAFGSRRVGPAAEPNALTTSDSLRRFLLIKQA